MRRESRSAKFLKVDFFNYEYLELENKNDLDNFIQ